MAVFYFAVLFKYEALVALIAFSIAAMGAQLIAGCTYDSDCDDSLNPRVCCNGECVYVSSCPTRFCTWYDSSCSTDESCCSHVCVYGPGCIGLPCSSNADCATGESCCDSECKIDCWGNSCSNASAESDCGDLMTCCYGTCQYTYQECTEPMSSTEKALVIIGAIVVALVIICVCCIGCNTSYDDDVRVRLLWIPKQN